jgi:hypothetical protein
VRVCVRLITISHGAARLRFVCICARFDFFCGALDDRSVT